MSDKPKDNSEARGGPMEPERLLEQVYITKSIEELEETLGRYQRDIEEYDKSNFKEVSYPESFRENRERDIAKLSKVLAVKKTFPTDPGKVHPDEQKDSASKKEIGQTKERRPRGRLNLIERLRTAYRACPQCGVRNPANSITCTDCFGNMQTGEKRPEETTTPFEPPKETPTRGPKHPKDDGDAYGLLARLAKDLKIDKAEETEKTEAKADAAGEVSPSEAEKKETNTAALNEVWAKISSGSGRVEGDEATTETADREVDTPTDPGRVRPFVPEAPKEHGAGTRARPVPEDSLMDVPEYSPAAAGTMSTPRSTDRVAPPEDDSEKVRRDALEELEYHFAGGSGSKPAGKKTEEGTEVEDGAHAPAEPAIIDDVPPKENILPSTTEPGKDSAENRNEAILREIDEEIISAREEESRRQAEENAARAPNESVEQEKREELESEEDSTNGGNESVPLEPPQDSLAGEVPAGKVDDLYADLTRIREGARRRGGQAPDADKTADTLLGFGDDTEKEIAGSDFEDSPAAKKARADISRELDALFAKAEEEAKETREGAKDKLKVRQEAERAERERQSRIEEDIQERQEVAMTARVNALAKEYREKSEEKARAERTSNRRLALGLAGAMGATALVSQTEPGRAAGESVRDLLRGDRTTISDVRIPGTGKGEVLEVDDEGLKEKESKPTQESRDTDSGLLLPEWRTAPKRALKPSLDMFSPLPASRGQLPPEVTAEQATARRPESTVAKQPTKKTEDEGEASRQKALSPERRAPQARETTKKETAPEKILTLSVATRKILDGIEKAVSAGDKSRWERLLSRSAETLVNARNIRGWHIEPLGETLEKLSRASRLQPQVGESARDYLNRAIPAALARR